MKPLPDPGCQKMIDADSKVSTIGKKGKTPMKTIIVNEIKDRDTKRKGTTFPGAVAEGMRAEIVPGVSIRLVGTYRAKEVDVTFKVGDMAEYGSYNLSYYGPIVGITAKTVTIQPLPKRLGLYEFLWRNWDFDLAIVKEQNADTMRHI